MCYRHLVAGKGKACSLRPWSVLHFITPPAPPPSCSNPASATSRRLCLPPGEEARLPQLPFLLSYLLPSLWGWLSIFLCMHSTPTPPQEQQ